MQGESFRVSPIVTILLHTVERVGLLVRTVVEMAGERHEQMSKMEEDVSLLKGPITYEDILGAGGLLGRNVVMPEDAALMQSAETKTYGKTRKGGAAAMMQAAAEENVKAGFVKKDDHSQVAEEGVVAQEILLPGMYI